MSKCLGPFLHKQLRALAYGFAIIAVPHVLACRQAQVAHTAGPTQEALLSVELDCGTRFGRSNSETQSWSLRIVESKGAVLKLDQSSQVIVLDPSMEEARFKAVAELVLHSGLLHAESDDFGMGRYDYPIQRLEITTDRRTVSFRFGDSRLFEQEGAERLRVAVSICRLWMAIVEEAGLPEVAQRFSPAFVTRLAAYESKLDGGL